MEHLDDYKKNGELPLAHQHLINIENIISPSDSIFLFDRNYNAMELYARIIEYEFIFYCKIKKRFI